MKQHVCMENKKDDLLVASIEIGNSFSLYAFSTKYNYHIDPTRVVINRGWTDKSNRSLLTREAPTVVLFDENKKFHSFGYEAEYAYIDLSCDYKHHNWYYFRSFKKALYGPKITRDTEIDDVRGRKMKVIDVVGAVINYIKEYLLNQLKSNFTDLRKDDIHWVLPVPDIWSDSAKQLMREAAYRQADIDEEQLSIVPNTIAASIYCCSFFREPVGAEFALARQGTKYMIIDFRGHTTNIIVHEWQADGSLKELYKARKGALGKNKVFEEFKAFLSSLIGGPVYQKFIDLHRESFLDLQRDFEIKMQSCRPLSEGTITLKIPTAITDTYEEENGEHITEAIKRSPYSGGIKWRWNKMTIGVEIFKNWIKPGTDKIVSYIKDILMQLDVQGTNTFFMVGKFTESAMQDAIMKAFPHDRLIIPDDARFAVLRGAVIFGHRPVTVTSRVSKYTYGINISPPFDPAIHPEDHRVIVGGINRCRDVFKIYIHKGETVRVGEGRSGKHVQLKSNETEMLLKVYTSTKMDPKFVDEDNTEYMGKVSVILPDSNEKIVVEVNMTIGETALIVEAVELSHHTRYRANFDYL